jgi:hypothetical protein
VVLSYLADHIDWTATLGQAYVAQSTDVMISVQHLRRMALSLGNLETTPEQEVVVEDDEIRIVPAQAGWIYVPRYSPGIVYHRRPSSGLAISFGVGLAIGAWLNDDFDWRGHRVYYHGWNGGGWIARSRPRIRVTTAYVSPRHANVRINRKVVERRVNYGRLRGYNAVHRQTTYDRVRGNRPAPSQGRPGGVAPRRGNAVLNRNINTRDPRLDRFRGRDDQARRRGDVRVAPEPRPPSSAPAPPRVEQRQPPPQPPPQMQPRPRGYGRAPGSFDPSVTSRRGQASREAAQRRPEARRVAPPPPAPRKAERRPTPEPSSSRAPRRK